MRTYACTWQFSHSQPSLAFSDQKGLGRLRSSAFCRYIDLTGLAQLPRSGRSCDSSTFDDSFGRPVRVDLSFRGFLVSSVSVNSLVMFGTIPFWTIPQGGLALARLQAIKSMMAAFTT